MKSLRNIANDNIFEIDYQACIKEAMQVMNENKNGSVILLRKSKPIGIITESDIVNALKEDISFDQKAIDIASKDIISTNENRPIEYAFDLLIQYNIRRLILTDSLGYYKGIVLQKDLFEYLEEDVYKIDLKVSDILKKNQEILYIDSSKSINEALKIMQDFHVGSVVVLNENSYQGILTQKDILKLTLNEIDFNEELKTYVNCENIRVKNHTLVTQVIELMKLKNTRRVVVFDENENLIGVLTNRDILKHIKGNYTRILQNKIKHAQEIMDILPEPIIEIFYSKNEEIIYWMNEQAKNVFGNLVEKDIKNLLNKTIWDEIKFYLLENKKVKNKSLKIQNSVYEISGTISKNINSNFIKLIFKDVTNYEDEKSKLQNLVDNEIKRRMDSEYLLMQQAKLATMGEMIGHIAHQWRQPLAQLGGILMNLESSYAFEELNEEYLNKKINHGNELLKYMSNTIEDFRNFFEPNRQKEVFDINEYIENSINIISASLTYHHINLEFEKSSEAINIVGFPSEFSQVILNILANAQDVLVQEKIKKPYIKISLKKEKEKVFIVIEDNGGGINKELIDKVFDIYFTTKSKKEGTGLGLYISKLIIETKLLGKIDVRNCSKGAVFTIELNEDSNN